jgi:hypothetical protein
MNFHKFGGLLGCAFLLSSCGNESTWNNAYETASALIKGGGEFEVSRKQVNDIPYATISAKVGKGAEAILVLGYVKPSGLQWVASNMASLVISGSGELLQTIGLEADLNKKSLVGKPTKSFIDVGLSAKDGYSVDYFYKAPKPKVIRAHCYMKNSGVREIEILEYKYKTVYFEEVCETKQGWKFKNEYWVDTKKGKLFQSRQHYLEKMPPILIKILKPFSG